jgi:hypothetical protein
VVENQSRDEIDGQQELRTPASGSSRLSTLSTLLECQVSRLQDLLPRILSRSTVRISFTTLGFRLSQARLSTDIPECRNTIGPLLPPRITSQSMVEINSILREFSTQTAYALNPLECQVSGLWDLLPHGRK